MSEPAGTFTPFFPHCIDSSMIAAWRSCPQKFFRTYMEHWKPRAESVHLVAGKAFASGLEVARREFYQLGKPPADAVAAGLTELMREYGAFQCPPESAKSCERMCGALEFYFNTYQLGSDPAVPITLPGGGRGIEFSFVEALDIRHPQTGDPLLYSGRADMIADFAGQVYIFDEKTTSSLGASWSKQWDLRSQFSAYSWAAKRAGIKVAGTIVRGVSILKTKYDTQQAITYRPDWEIERWYAQLQRDVTRMIAAWQTNVWDYNLDHSCSEYGGCGFLQICKSQDPETWLPMQFQRKVWDPIMREELSPEEYLAKANFVKPNVPAAVVP